MSPLERVTNILSHH